MWRKKVMAVAAAAMVMTVMAASPVFAHGHGSRRQATVAASNTVSLACTIDGCSETGYHTHDSHGYWGCYPVCTADGCSETGHHTHDGHDCWGYYPVCTVEGCSETGHHVHDDHNYCGYSHRSGYCDNSCQMPSGSAGYGCGHHGCR